MSKFFRNTFNSIKKLVGLPSESAEEGEPEWVRVGEVSELLVYPLLESPTKFVAQTALCSNEGLMYQDLYDGSFVIFRATNRLICDMKEYPVLQHITVRRINGVVSLESEFCPSIQFGFADGDIEILPITPVRIHENEIIFVRDCGKEAAEWVSEYILRSRRGLRLGYYIYSDHVDYILQTKDDWPSILYEKRNPLNFHIDVNNRYSILNLSSFDKMNDTLECIRHNVLEYDFRPNIIIKTQKEDAFQEFKWEQMKINDLTFEKIESCSICSQNKLENYFRSRHVDMLLFRKTLQSQIKKCTNSKVAKYETSITIDMKLSSERGTIACGDPVYIKKRK